MNAEFQEYELGKIDRAKFILENPVVVFKQTYKKVIRILMDHIHLINECINNNFMEYKFFYQIIIYSLKQVYQTTKSYRCKLLT